MIPYFRSRYLGLTVFLSLSLLVCSGCKPSGQFHPAKGTVLVGGKPATGVVVTLVPEGDPKGSTPTASGKVSEDGAFSLNTYAADTRTVHKGARPGRYIVLLAWAPALTRENLDQINPGTDLLAGRYSDPTTSPLRVEVAKGGAELPPIELNASEVVVTRR
jgi:hypothetical protein